MMPRAFICGCSGLVFTDDERRFLADMRPWGLILFKRNIDNPQQVHALTTEFRDLSGCPNAPVLVDQEGGRVQRLGAPHWPHYPPAIRFGQLALPDARKSEIVRVAARLIGQDLRACGIDGSAESVVCTEPGA